MTPAERILRLIGQKCFIAFKNDDANNLAAMNESEGIPALANGGFEKLWVGTKLFPAGRLGVIPLDEGGVSQVDAE